MAKRIAIVEDEAELAALLDYNLTRGGYQAYVLSGNKGALKDLEAWKPDLIVLDVMLPGDDGFELCRQIRQSPILMRTPVLFLTARSDEVDRVLGLEIGGDDYMTKPFSPRELVARVKAHLRRADRDEDEDSAVEAGPFKLDRGAHRVFLNGSELDLTSTEYKLLGILSDPRRPGVQPRSTARRGLGATALRHAADCRRAYPPLAGAYREGTRQSALSDHRARLRLSLRRNSLSPAVRGT